MTDRCRGTCPATCPTVVARNAPPAAAPPRAPLGVGEEGAAETGRGPSTTAAAIGRWTNTAARSLLLPTPAGADMSPHHLGRLVIAAGAEADAAAAAAGAVTGVADATAATFHRHRTGQRAAAGAAAAAAASLAGERPLAGGPAAALGARSGGTKRKAGGKKRKTTTTSASPGRRCTKDTRRLAERGPWRDLRDPRKVLVAAGEEGGCGSDINSGAVGGLVL